VSIYRKAARVDAAQREIALKLQDIGIQVWQIRRPCDLLLRFWCTRHRDHCWQPLEIKTPNRKDGTARLRKDQDAQTQFLLETQTPVASTFEEALNKLNQRHALVLSLKPVA
jgi:hypothetical protein